MNLQENLKKYAKLLVCSGLNVQENQLVIVQAPIESYELVREVVNCCFERKAKDVIVRYNDEIIDHTRYMNKSADSFKEFPQYEADLFNNSVKEGACYLYLVGDDPDLMADIEAKKIANYVKARNEATKEYRDARSKSLNAWSIGAVSTQKWAEKVYPNEENPKEKLWEAIFKVARVSCIYAPT